MVHSVSAVYSSTVLPDSDDTAFPRCSADDEHETHPNKVSYIACIPSMSLCKILEQIPVHLSME